jgi:glutaredoxin 3
MSTCLPWREPWSQPPSCYRTSEMARIILYTTDFCSYCRAAKQLLLRKGLDFEEVDVGADHELRIQMVRRAGGRRTVPQIFIDDHPIGGYLELAQLERDGRLDVLLANEPGAVEP